MKPSKFKATTKKDDKKEGLNPVHENPSKPKKKSTKTK